MLEMGAYNHGIPPLFTHEGVIMSFVEIRDHALWAKHIHGNPVLKEKVLSMGEGELIKLKIDGFEGMWVKMDDGKDGRATQGLKAIGPARIHWHELQSKRGELISIEAIVG